MSAGTVIAATPKWWPNLEGQIAAPAAQAHRLTFDWLNQHEIAFAALKQQITQITNGDTPIPIPATTNVTNNTSVTVAQVAATLPFILGQVNNQTDVTYIIQNSDYGSLVTLDNAAGVAVTLNQSVQKNWFGVLENLGTGTVTVTPDTTLGPSLVNGVASLTLAQNESAWFFYDGLNWWAATVPAAGGAGVTQLVPGDNVQVSPGGGTGVVTVSATGAGVFSFPIGVGTFPTGFGVTGTQTTIYPAGTAFIANLYDSAGPSAALEFMAAFAYATAAGFGYSVLNVSSATVTTSSTLTVYIRALL